MTGKREWRHTCKILGFAFMLIGAIMTIIGIVPIGHPVTCPAGGYNYNLAHDIGGLPSPTGLTLVISGVVVFWTVQTGSEREDRESP